MNRDEQDLDGGTLRGSGSAAAFTTKVTRPLPPKQFIVERLKDGVRFRVIGRDPKIEQDSARKYRVRWAESVDASTTTGQNAGYARSIIVSTIDAPGKDGVEATDLLQDGAYANGYFYCEGVDNSGGVSDYVLSSFQSGEVLNTAVPNDVTHPQVTESGERHGGSTMSALSVSCRAPNPLGSFGRVQLWYRNYPAFGGLNEGESFEFNGPAGAYIQFPARNAIGRNKGVGTVTLVVGNPVILGVGTSFLSQVNATGLFEALGVQGTIQSVDSDTQITLTAGWVGNAAAGLSDFYVYPQVVVYLVAVSKGGTHRSDVENSPSVAVVFDGNLSAPNAPAVVSTPMGNLIRLDITPLIGTDIDHYAVYRAVGAGQTLAAAKLNGVFGTVPHNPRNVAGTVPFEDEKFSLFDRENAQTFTYWVTAVTTGTQPLESTGTHAFLADGVTDPSCRLDSPSDGGGTEPARFVAKNLLWNAMFSGTPGGVSLADAVQDSSMGGAAPAGFNRWAPAITGVGAAPAFQNNTEVLLAIAGAVGATGSSILSQFIGAWASGGGDQRVPIGKMLTFQVKGRHSAGNVNGFLKAEIEQWFGGAYTGTSAKLQQRLSDDSLDYSSSVLIIPGTSLTDVHSLYQGAFLLDAAVPTDKIKMKIWYETTSYSGVNLVITEPMLSLGDGLPYWCAEVDKNTTYPGPTGGAASRPPGRFGDQDGAKRDRVLLP